MLEQEARRIIADTFNQPYDETRFRYLIRNLINGIEELSSHPITGNIIPDSFSKHVSKYTRIGKYTDPDGNRIDVLAVHLKREAALDQARTIQRNFIAHYLNGGRGGMLRDAAIVAFYTDDPDDWRFSFVRMDYKTEQDEKGKVRVKSELTPARRYSFLVGKYEPNHTAQQQFAGLLRDEKAPPLTELENAFRIESVTKKFFEEYKGLFLKLKDELDELVLKDLAIREDFAEKEVDTANFVKKLLGQIVFLYFLQKKGWLGVGRDETGKFKNWGSGPKDFLRKLFNKEIGTGYQNFFNDVLEPLFYEALAYPRENDIYIGLDCKIPFLNGGLFEPIAGYNWQETNIFLRNETFAKIFETFDNYNFTVREDEPLEKEVAVDPEMLGKVFENLLEVVDRKSKGAFYTPREIVHYMCQEGLINYLDTTLNQNVTGEQECLCLDSNAPAQSVARAEIGTFVRTGEFLAENDRRVVSQGKETKTYSWLMPASIRDNAFLIDEALETIRICDPAIGSGAFPVGVLHEIVKAREVLTTYIGDSLERTRYKFKRHAIQESIFGVDIDPGAVEIAKLRLWLSLVVDEDDYHTINPLPNLDYKIMQGNSLFEEYEGIKLFDDRLIKTDYSENMQNIEMADKRLAKLQKEYLELHKKGHLNQAEKKRLKTEIKKQTALITSLHEESAAESDHVGLFHFGSDAFKTADELKLLHKRIFDVSQKSVKDGLRKQIEALEWRLIDETLKEQGKLDALERIQSLKKSSHKPFFIWKLHFSEVFLDKGGFDLVIANPPYVRHEAIKAIKPGLAKEFGSFYCGTADLYTYFYKKGLDLLKPAGHLCFIAPNKFMRAGYGKNTRVLLGCESTPKVVIDFGDLPIFDATTYPSILLLEKRQPTLKKETLTVTFTEAAQLERLEETIAAVGFSMPISALKAEGWTLERHDVLALMAKLCKAGTPLGDYVQGRFYRGVLTGLNKAFVIDEATRTQLIADDPKSSELIKPWMRGRDIRKWKAQWAGLYVIFTRRGTDIEKYPAIKRHLVQFQEDLEPKKEKLKQEFKKNKDDAKVKGRKPGSYNWFEIQDNIAYFEEFEKVKIVYQEIATFQSFGYAESGCFCNNKCFLISHKDDFLLSLLNSKLFWWFLGNLTSGLVGGARAMQMPYMEQLPIFPATDTQKAPIIERVQKILANPNSPAVPQLEAEIDRLVYELYGLTEEEIALVEGKNK
ncbi:MAG: TaqI-like C-terminal specificity domain-containing protein [Desulfuromonadaceae bacterium]|nr:TaqI-like C-terminal specificity domain-containing protein [Desulfuromonadaceae bacterium]